MKVQPKVPLDERAVNAEELAIGECFIDGGCLFMVIDISDDPRVIDLGDGSLSDYGDDVAVVPVDCTITWAKKGQKKKKKK